jgi:lipopolysaccharide transport system permease protein
VLPLQNPMRSLHLLRLFVRQDLRQRFSGNLIGVAWAVLAPLLQLAVFNLVFVHILKARVPGLEGSSYLVFLALGFWPWFAFSEAVARGCTAITEHSGLAGKIAVPRAIPVLAAVGSAFLLHGLGYVLVLCAIALTGPTLDWTQLPMALLYWLPLLAMAAGLALALSAVQVFVRDLAQSIGLLITLWFFLTPIIYAPETVPGALTQWLSLNPITGVVDAQRGLLPGLTGLPLSWVATWLGALLIPLVAGLVFGRLLPHLEEFE